MKLKTELLFKLLKLVKKAGLLQEIKGIFKSVGEKSKGKNENEIRALQEEIGMDMFIKLLEGLDNAEAEFYDVVANVKEISTEQAKELEWDELAETVKAIFASEVFKSFLSSLSK